MSRSSWERSYELWKRTKLYLPKSELIYISALLCKCPEGRYAVLFPHNWVCLHKWGPSTLLMDWWVYFPPRKSYRGTFVTECCSFQMIYTSYPSGCTLVAKVPAMLGKKVSLPVPLFLQSKQGKSLKKTVFGNFSDENWYYKSHLWGWCVHGEVAWWGWQSSRLRPLDWPQPVCGSATWGTLGLWLDSSLKSPVLWLLSSAVWKEKCWST